MSDNNLEKQLEELDAKEDEFGEQCLHRSQVRIANEIRRLSKAERQVVPYVRATFTLMNNGAALLDPQMTRDAALEMISLLESADRARAFQPNFPEAEFENLVHWYSSCSYDNLATGIASLNGYNSEGTHDCIADGIQVCRQTGKLQCVTCFREYAGDVYRAADDLEMAMHYAQVGMARDKPGPHDRRWTSAKDVTSLLLLQGNFEEAAHALQRQAELIGTWHNPLSAEHQTRLHSAEISLLLGKEAPSEEDLAQGMPPADECPDLKLQLCQLEAVRLACQNRLDDSIELLKDWDQKLTQAKFLSEWLKHRLRLLSVLRMASRDNEFDRLAAQLEKKAKAARDWLTLRCLKRLRQSDTRDAPVPLVADPNSGPFASSTSLSTEAISSDQHVENNVGETAKPMIEEGDSDTHQSSEEQQTSPPDPPEELVPYLTRYGKALQAEDDSAESIHTILADLLQLNPAEPRSASDTHWLLHGAKFFVGDAERGAEIWAWALAVAQQHSEDPKTQSLLATLGCSLKFNQNTEIQELIEEDQLKAKFQQSLDADPDNAGNFERAGDFYQFVRDPGAAERCYARAFRLKRGEANFASKLARIYRQTERERDALEVLDMCIREGANDPDLLWEAALTASSVDRHENVLTYLDAYEKLVPEKPWCNYYRAASLIALRRPEEALKAIKTEEAFYEAPRLHTQIQRAISLLLQGSDEAKTAVAQVLTSSFCTADDLTRTGYGRLMASLWDTAKEHLEDREQLEQLKALAVQTGLAPDELFDRTQNGSDQCEVNFYECTVCQPLDDRWKEWPARLHEEESDWNAYLQCYGVLAETEEQASRLVLACHQGAFPLKATIQDITEAGSGYNDHVGIVWQGFRFAEPTGDLPR